MRKRGRPNAREPRLTANDAPLRTNELVLPPPRLPHRAPHAAPRGTAAARAGHGRPPPRGPRPFGPPPPADAPALRRESRRPRGRAGSAAVGGGRADGRLDRTPAPLSRSRPAGGGAVEALVGRVRDGTPHRAGHDRRARRGTAARRARGARRQGRRAVDDRPRRQLHRPVHGPRSLEERRLRGPLRRVRRRRRSRAARSSSRSFGRRIPSSWRACRASSSCPRASP